MLHNILLRPHLEWLSTTIYLSALAAFTMDWTTLAVSLMTLATAVLAYMTARIRSAVETTKIEVKELKVHTNSILDEIKKAAFAKGILEGGEAEKERRDLEDLNKAKGGQEEKTKRAEKESSDEPKK